MWIQEKTPVPVCNLLPGRAFYLLPDPGKGSIWGCGCLQQGGNGGRGCPDEPWSHPTAWWESSITWAGNGCILRGLGQDFICCESATGPLMLVGLTGGLVQEPCDNR